MLGEALGVEIDKVRVKSPRPSPRRTSQHHQRSVDASDDVVPQGPPGKDSQQPVYPSSVMRDRQAHAPAKDSSQGYREKDGSGYASRTNKDGAAAGYRRRRREGGLRTRVTRQSPVEERLSVHEDDAVNSDAFDDEGLFQIDDNFAKFLDDKTSCQK